jgi:hypothetical protein
MSELTAMIEVPFWLFGLLGAFAGIGIGFFFLLFTGRV